MLILYCAISGFILGSLIFRARELIRILELAPFLDQQATKVALLFLHTALLLKSSEGARSHQIQAF